MLGSGSNQRPLGLLDKLALAIGSGLSLVSCIIILWPGGLLESLSSMHSGTLQTTVGAVLGLSALATIWWLTHSLRNEYCQTMAGEVKTYLAREREELDQATKNAHSALETLEQLQSGLTPLLDKVEKRDWYLSWEQFQAREAQLHKASLEAGNRVTAYIISRSLKFDTDDTLLPHVTTNLASGTCYKYILPESGHDLCAEKEQIIHAVEQAPPVEGKTKGNLQFCHTSDGSLFAEMAIFEHFKAGGPGMAAKKDFEAFLAIEDGNKRTPWLRLGPVRSRWLYGAVSKIAKSAETQ